MGLHGGYSPATKTSDYLTDGRSGSFYDFALWYQLRLTYLSLGIRVASVGTPAAVFAATIDLTLPLKTFEVSAGIVGGPAWTWGAKYAGPWGSYYEARARVMFLADPSIDIGFEIAGVVASFGLRDVSENNASVLALPIRLVARYRF